MNDPRLRKAPVCVCKCPELAHTGDRDSCITPGCPCCGYWPGEVRQAVTPLPPGRTRPVAR